ncbi:unnamed protein product [Anisakis simplex]|uniref:SEC7 domain-containing protein n=1 Tax=Anisakis simplex TaxID=6269 RepID=A0A0M3K8V0_ANISI|nr:unnamed protein product [Anisakis simplex]
MTEVMVGGDRSMEITPKNREVSSSSVKSAPPRYEAFLMTGDTMFIVDHKISPRYAEVCGDQLPPSTAVRETPVRPVGAFDDYPSKQQKMKTRRFNAESAVPASQSDNGLNTHAPTTPDSTTSPLDEQKSTVTVNADGGVKEERENGSDVTVSSSAVSSQYSLTSSTTRSPTIDRRINLFNQSSCSTSEPNTPAKGAMPIINNFVSTVVCPSPPHELDHKSEIDNEASSRLAKRLYALDGFRKTDVAAHLSKTNEFGLAVADEYCGLFNFLGIRLDVAIREFLSRFCLTGETQQRTRIIEHFAKRYHQCNPTLFTSADEVHALTCALLLLNSDLHGPNVGRRMSSREFIDNISQTEHTFDRSLLKTLYGSIRDQPIKWAEDESELEKSNETSASNGSALNQRERGSGLLDRKKRKSFTNKSKSVVADDDQIEYKAGWVVRKSVYDRDGNRSILRVQLSSCDPNEVQRWIDTINYVAAAFSSPALPAPVSNDTSVFHKPLLPSAPSKLTITEQLRAHEGKELEVRQRLEELMRQGPPLNTKGSAVYDFFYKERYLYQERERYELYVSVLRSRLSALSPSNAHNCCCSGTALATSNNNCNELRVCDNEACASNNHQPNTSYHLKTDVVREEPEELVDAREDETVAVGSSSGILSTACQLQKSSDDFLVALTNATSTKDSSEADSSDRISYKEAIMSSPNTLKLNDSTDASQS